MRRFFGAVLLAIGLLIAGGSGLCTIAVMGSALSSGGAEALGLVPLALIFGGIPFAIGLGLIFWGRWLISSSRIDRIDPDDFA